MPQIHIRADEDLINDIKKIANEKNTKTNQVLIEALKFYRDYHFMKNKASLINEEILNIVKSSVNVLEKNINKKTNIYLSEIASQSAITNLILANSLDLNPDIIKSYKVKSIAFLKEHQRILRLEELI